MSRPEEASSRRATLPPGWLRSLLVLISALLLLGGCADGPSHADDDRVGTAEQAAAPPGTPTIASFTPTTGAEGATVTVTGTNLGGATLVTFDGIASTQVTGVTSTQLSAVVPAGATSGTIAVTTPSGTATSAKSFGVLPTISGFTPASGAPGDTVSISGTGFIGTTGVKLGTIAAAFTFESDVLLTVTVPAGALTDVWSVTKASGTATSAASFTVAPTITSFTPASGIQGTAVTIKGKNLLGTTAVSFGGVDASASITSITATSVVATVPVGSSTGTIMLTTPGGTATSADAFNVVPTLDGFTPLSGPVGATVTITGTGLLGATVAFGTVAATTSSVTDTSITTTVPATATTGKITVTTAGGSAKSGGTFTVVVSPTIKSFSPTSGPPATTTVGIKGTGFTDLTGVSFGGVPSTDFTVTSDTAATAIVPELAVTGTVTVTNAAGSATSTGVFTVIDPDPCAGVTCVALDQCHVAGTCSGGVCSNPTATDGTACNDGNPCTQTDTCQSGTCVGSNPVVCTAEDSCHTAGVCSPGGKWGYTCSNPAVADGTACNDGNPCTQTDVCVAGACTGENPVTCVALDTCHAAGTCDPASGTCSNPTLPDGTGCNDGNACTQNDVCTGGSCAGTAYTCPAPGNPSFATSEYPANEGYPDIAVTADVNGDGKLDVVVNCSYGIGVLLGNGDGTLKPGVDYSYGIGGDGLVLADVNGDGKLDAVTFAGTLGVMAFLGNGDGTFGPPILSTTIATSSNDDTWLDVGDLDGDGKPDAVVVHTDESTLAVMLGNGDGTFQAEVDYQAIGDPFPGSASFVKLADVNLDGKLDAVVANANGGPVSVLLGNGDGTLGAPTDFPVYQGGQHLAVGDLNGDGIPDVIQPADGGYVSVLLGKGDGTFLPYQAFPIGFQGGYPGAALGDFNGDGKLDVAVVIGGTPQGQVALLLGNGDGTLQAPVVLATPAPSAHILAAGDLRGVGKVDLIIPMNDDSTNVAVLLNAGVSAQCVSGAGTCNGDGTCSFANLPNGTACNNGNACTQADQCVGGVCQGTPLVCSGPNATEACVAGACAVTACSPGFADCDQQAADGCEVDLASSSSSCGSCGNACVSPETCTQGACAAVSCFPTFTQFPVGTDTSSAPDYVAVGDLNGDGIPDLAVADYNDDTVSVLINQGNGTFAASVNYPTGAQPSAVAIADLNGDGKLDLAVTNQGVAGEVDGSVSVLLNQGNGTFAAAVGYPTGGGTANSVAVADLNGDGSPDLVVVNYADTTISLLFNQGNGTFAAALTYQVPGNPVNGGSNPASVVAVDLNGDGLADIALANESADQVDVLINQGDGTVAPVGSQGLEYSYWATYPAAGPSAIAAADLNGDGFVDLVTSGTVNNDVSVLLNQGNGTFAAAVTYPAGTFPYSVVAADMNGDGKRDLVVANYRGTTGVSVLLNQGGGTFGAPVTYPAGSYPAWAAVADLNGDGLPDIAAADFGLYDGNTVSVLLDTCQPSPPPASGGNTFVAGELHSLVIKSDGTVWASGYNLDEALGNGTQIGSDVPVQAIGMTRAISLAVEDVASFALRYDGTVWAWGSGYGSTPAPIAGIGNVTAIAGTYHHVVALKKDGTVWSWGDNSYGQLGNPAAGGSSVVPVQAVGVSGVAAIAAGLFHTLALTTDGNLWAWGHNLNGELGNGTTISSATPIQVMGISGVATIAAGGFTSFAQKTVDHSLWVWGAGGFGQIANGANADVYLPVQITTISNVTSIAAGDGYLLALKSDQTVWTWGRNDFGQLGDGTTTNRNLPVQAVGLTNVTTLAPSFGGSLVMRSDGTLWGWGLNDYGQLADGTVTTPRPTPEQTLLP